MTNRQRWLDVLNFKKPEDRLPVMEWASWWDKTIRRWRNEGMPSDVNPFDYFGLDHHIQYWIAPRRSTCPGAKHHGARVIRDLTMEAYEEIKPHLFPREDAERYKERFRRIKEGHDRGDFPVWLSFEGFFWFPRTLFGIEDHFYAYWDCPEVIHAMNRDITDFYKYFLEEVCTVLEPDFMTFAEDMSYNHGPMLSHDLYKEFMLPYYLELVPLLKKHGIKVLIDTDGKLEPMIPWMLEAGIEGVLPLEKQAGVNVAQIRKDYPDFIMIGAFDKTCMHMGEEAMRAEFERLLPVMRSGGFIPGVDHQTPPLVSLDDYRLYLKLYNEYARKAVQDG